VPRHVARLVTRLVAPLVIDYSALRRLVVEYFTYAARPSAWHVARTVTRLIVDYSVRSDFVLWPRWLYFSHAVRRDYLSRGNTGSI
jgi:hypothetical protein